MVEVGIPVYHARDTLAKGLDSLVAQTVNNFIVCLSIDGDSEDYSDIIFIYTARGLNIRIINSEVNGGPGAARQRIIDTTSCEYLIFMDADDMLTPRAVEILTEAIDVNNCDIVRSGFVREDIEKQDVFVSYNSPIVTWFHGKIYRTKFLREKNIRFLPDLRVDEDAYFNLVAWNLTKNRGQVNEYTYIWRDNKNSITRAQNTLDYFRANYINYIISQVEAFKKIFEVNKNIEDGMITPTLINIYYIYMRAAYFKYDMNSADNLIMQLKEQDQIQSYLNKAENWIDIVNNVKAGEVYNTEYVIFYDEPINHWIVRLLT